MWICLNNAFLSAIEDRYDNNYLMVRARIKKHLEDVFSNRLTEIFSIPNSDYAWRIRILKSDYADIISKKILEEITYDNFKNSVNDDLLHDWYYKIWYHGYILQSSTT